MLQKAIGEYYVKYYSEKYNINNINVRIFNTYGPRMDTGDCSCNTRFYHSELNKNKNLQ